jgi:hypothetical protein
VKLPNVERAETPKEKITGYLLSITHRDGRHKATFFMAHGFSVEAWETLAKALREHAAENEIAKTEQTPFGTRYIVEGPLKTPDGRNPMVRAVWFVEWGETIPRLATAYQLK